MPLIYESYGLNNSFQKTNGSPFIIQHNQAENGNWLVNQARRQNAQRKTLNA